MSTRDPHHVKRTRVADHSVAAEAGFHQPVPVGSVRYSKTFPTAAAQREADAWNTTEDWTAQVVPGKAPR